MNRSSATGGVLNTAFEANAIAEVEAAESSDSRIFYTQSSSGGISLDPKELLEIPVSLWAVIRKKLLVHRPLIPINKLQ